MQKIQDRSCQEIPGSINLGGVGKCKMESPRGIYLVKLPLYNGKNAVLSGICLDKITSTFPIYHLKGDVEKDIQKVFQACARNVKDLPSLPSFVSGDVDFMVGAKYLRYHLEKVGLTIYKSFFKNIDGSRGVVGGRHRNFTAIEKQTSDSNMCRRFSFITEQYELYKMGFQINPDNHLLSVEVDKQFDISDPIGSSCVVARKEKRFEEVENAGSEILYRCIDCRECGKCKHGEQIEMLSYREEVEQDDK